MNLKLLLICCVFFIGTQANMARISDILSAEFTESFDCNAILSVQNTPNSLGQKIAQVVCETNASRLKNFAFASLKYALFGLTCSLLTYLVTVTSKQTLEYDETDGKNTYDETTLDAGMPADVDVKMNNKVAEIVLLKTVQMPNLDVFPANDETDLTLSEKSLDKDVTKEGFNPADFRNLAEIPLEDDLVIDFEDYRKNIDSHLCYKTRPRRFSDPTGCKQYIPYKTLEEVSCLKTFADIATLTIGEQPDIALPVNLQHTAEYDIAQPGSPRSSTVVDTLGADHNEGGLITNYNGTRVPQDQKINQRKPMVFVGGVSASTTPLELVTELKNQGFNVTVLPRIRYGVSFGFCPDLVLSTADEVEKLLEIGRVWVKDRWVDIRPYIPKDEPIPHDQPTNVDSFVDFHGNDIDIDADRVEYISAEDLLTSCPTSPSTSQNQTPTMGNSPLGRFTIPMNGHHPFIQMAQCLPFSPGQIPPHMMTPQSNPHMMTPQFFPNCQQFPPEFTLHPSNHSQTSSPHFMGAKFQTPSPPGFNNVHPGYSNTREVHPMSNGFHTQYSQ